MDQAGVKNRLAPIPASLTGLRERFTKRGPQSPREVPIDYIQTSPSFYFILRGEELHPEQELRVPAALLLEFSDRFFNGCGGECNYYFPTKLEKDAAEKIIDWLEGHSNHSDWWDDLDATIVIQIYAFAALFDIHTLERLVLEFLDLTLLNLKPHYAGKCPSDDLMTWAWSITSEGSVVRTYLLRVCFWYVMLGGIHLGQSWRSRLAGSWVSGLNDLVLSIVGDLETANSLKSIFDAKTDVPDACEDYLSKARHAVVPFGMAENCKLGRQTHKAELRHLLFPCYAETNSQDRRSRSARPRECSATVSARPQGTANEDGASSDVGQSKEAISAGSSGRANVREQENTDTGATPFISTGFGPSAPYRSADGSLKGWPTFEEVKFSPQSTIEDGPFDDYLAAFFGSVRAAPPGLAPRHAAKHKLEGRRKPQTRGRASKAGGTKDARLGKKPRHDNVAASSNKAEALGEKRVEASTAPASGTASNSIPVAFKSKAHAVQSPPNLAARTGKVIKPRKCTRPGAAERSARSKNMDTRMRGVASQDRADIDSALYARLTTGNRRGKVVITGKGGKSERLHVDLLCHRSSLISEMIRDNPEVDKLGFPGLFIEDFENLHGRIYRSPMSKLSLCQKISGCLAAEHLGMLSILEEGLFAIRDDPHSHQLDSSVIELLHSRAPEHSRLRVMLRDLGNTC